MRKKIIGWEEKEFIEENFGINNEKLLMRYSYEPIFEVSEKEIYKKAVKKWGKPGQMVVAIEELSELIQALSKSLRTTKEIKASENMIEEIADCKIMIEQLELMFGITEEVIEQKNKKLERLSKLLWEK